MGEWQNGEWQKEGVAGTWIDNINERICKGQSSIF